VRFIPSWLPGASFRVKAQSFRPVIVDFVESPFAEAEVAVVRMNLFQLTVKKLKQRSEKWKCAFFCCSSANRGRHEWLDTESEGASGKHLPGWRGHGMITDFTVSIINSAAHDSLSLQFRPSSSLWHCIRMFSVKLRQNLMLYSTARVFQHLTMKDHCLTLQPSKKRFYAGIR
jgi:hypothetical protein